MSVWDTYPEHYRFDEIRRILKAVQAGECVSLVGLSGAGKSNLLGFLAHRAEQGPCFLLVDCNDLPTVDSASLFSALLAEMGEKPAANPDLRDTIRVVEKILRNRPGGLCVLLDRFDLFNGAAPEQLSLASNLRSLRDHFKYSLTYIIATRQPLEPSSELAELFCANMLWLGPLGHEDALWSVGQYATRHGLDWDAARVEQIITLSQGYPSMLRAVCEACSAGVPLEVEALRAAPAVQRRVAEFWDDHPQGAFLQQSRLSSHPLICSGQPARVDAAELTAAEQRLLDYLAGHPDQVCDKATLMQAVWPDEKVAAGLRDDSLTQLVHRLREKVDLGGKKHIETIPGRGYRFRA